jgi:hypothetical protein
MGRGQVDVDPISQMGGSNRFITFLTLVIHFIHPLLCIANYLDWVRHQSGSDSLGEKRVAVYLAMSIIAALFYLLIASVFYMWAWRYPEPEEISKRRRIYGVIVNLIFSDFPIFLVEVDIVWEVGFATGLQATSFLFTCFSLAYSGFRVWTFVMVKVIKSYAPPQGVMAGASTFSPRAFDATGGMGGHGGTMGGGGGGFQGGQGGMMGPPGGAGGFQPSLARGFDGAGSMDRNPNYGRPVGGVIPMGGMGQGGSMYSTPGAGGMGGGYRDPSPYQH